jgi:hypothetical protein
LFGPWESEFKTERPRYLTVFSDPGSVKVKRQLVFTPADLKISTCPSLMAEGDLDVIKQTALAAMEHISENPDK